jgi:hypothetical protein
MPSHYDFESINGLLGQQETQRLEFKSSRDLLDENPQNRDKFISRQIVPAVSAFLNTDGGQLVIGIEEKDGAAAALSDGVPRSRQKWEQLQSVIIGRIQPAVAGYVNVSPVQIGENAGGEKLFAFVVDVKPGTTAYQANDKMYYVRRSGQSEAMEDKDIRLRMLAGDKPRIVIGLQSRILENVGQLSHLIQAVKWDLTIENVGVRTIPRAIVRRGVSAQGLSEMSLRTVEPIEEYRRTGFPIAGLEDTGLLPGQRFELPDVFSAPSIAFFDCVDTAAVTMTGDVIVYIDEGFPAELRNYDLMEALRPVIDNNWTIPQS